MNFESLFKGIKPKALNTLSSIQQKLPGSSRPAHSLLFITEVHTVRIDTDRAGIHQGEAQHFDFGCRNQANLADCFSRVAEFGTPLGRKVWLLVLQLPVHFVSIPSMQVDGLEGDNLEQVLKFELESLTGFSLMDDQLAYQLIGSENDMNDYRVSQINPLNFDDLLKASKKAGSKLGGMFHPAALGGLFHPAALPVAISNPDEQDWLRLESWPTQTLAIRHYEDGRLIIRSFQPDERSRQSELEQWMAEYGDARLSETLLNNKLEMLPATDKMYRLHDDGQITVWLQQWAEQLTQSKALPVPVLRPLSKINKELTIRIGTGLAAFVLCASHFSWYLLEAYEYEDKTVQLTQFDETMKGLRKSVNSVRDKEQKLRKSINQMSNDSTLIPRLINTLRMRPALLLVELSLHVPDGVVIERISPGDNTIVVEGVALKGHYANQMATDLEQRLATIGWTITTPDKNDMGLLPEGGPWSFSMTLEDIGLEAFNTEAAS